jgi:hypothetical protein
VEDANAIMPLGNCVGRPTEVDVMSPSIVSMDKIPALQMPSSPMERLALRDYIVCLLNAEAVFVMPTFHETARFWMINVGLVAVSKLFKVVFASTSQI